MAREYAGVSALRYRMLDAALGRGLLPDPVLRAGSRWGAFARERRESRGGVVAQEARLGALVERMSSGPVAEVPEKANEQHYQLPSDFIGLILGPRRKYSGCLWDRGVEDLAQAEEAMLALTCARAQVRDGQRILDLGCGWGSLSLWLAERYPGAEVVGVSNSNSQRAYIEGRAAELGLRNLSILTADVNELEPPGRFDRVLSIEMFEHMRNWKELLRRVSTWLEPAGKAFVHVFSHRTLPYLFESTWAAERFFTAGLMPSHELILRFQDDMRVDERWAVPGTHYARTLQAWLANLDSRRDEALAALRTNGRSERDARRLLGAWRLFLLSTDEIWRYRGGNRWLVSHYLLEPR
ncbi:MAG: cyclopropane-fatty-acyl-phospholipid synthase [Solirubrobacterales bacterium]|nr:cyclopropane-fatty-acyl-phospholipid synthase [Solirubrobacterales bacterium]